MRENTLAPAQSLERKTLWERVAGYVLAAPAVILLLVFTVYPVCYLFYRSMLGGNRAISE